MAKTTPTHCRFRVVVLGVPFLVESSSPSAGSEMVFERGGVGGELPKARPGPNASISYFSWPMILFFCCKIRCL